MQTAELIWQSMALGDMLVNYLVSQGTTGLIVSSRLIAEGLRYTLGHPLCWVQRYSTNGITKKRKNIKRRDRDGFVAQTSLRNFLELIYYIKRRRVDFFLAEQQILQNLKTFVVPVDQFQSRKCTENGEVMHKELDKFLQGHYTLKTKIGMRDRNALPSTELIVKWGACSL